MRMGHDVSAIVGKIHVSKMAYLINSSSDANGDKVILPFMICDAGHADEQFIEDLLDTICYEERQGYRTSISASNPRCTDDMWSLYARFHDGSQDNGIVLSKIPYNDATAPQYCHHDAVIQIRRIT